MRPSSQSRANAPGGKSKPAIPRDRGIGRFSRAIPILFWTWAAIAALGAACQPFELGLYLDDWGVSAEAATHGAPFGAERFRYLYSIDPSRPTIAPLRYLLSSALSDIPSRWQFALVLSNLAVAYALYLVLRSLFAPRADRHCRLCIAVALAWMAIPWIGAVHFWPVMLPVNILVAAFGACLAWIFREWQSGRGPAIWPCLAYLIACTSYEGFYLQFVPVALIGLALWHNRRASVSSVARTVAALAGAQAAAVAWYFASGILTTAQKPVSGSWTATMTQNLSKFVPEMLRGTWETAGALVAGCAGLLCASAAIAYYRSRAEAESESAPWWFFGACIVAAPVSLVAFSLGGRPALGLGVDSRAMLFASFWLIVALGALAAAASARDGWLRVAAVGCGAVIGAALAGGNVARQGEWATAWRLQTKYLAEAPVEEIARIPAGSEVLYLGPMDVDQAPVFMAPWDINTAMPLRHPSLAKARFTVFSKWMAPGKWDGAIFRYGDYIAARSSSIYIWKPEWREFYKAEKPFTVLWNGSVKFD